MNNEMVRNSLERLKHVRGLVETGQLAEVVATLERDEGAVEQSPSLALFYGTAQARMGDVDEGLRWIKIALELSRVKGDRAVELRALNARGAIALASGAIDEALDYFIFASDKAERDGDHATVGRCSNNLGIIYNLRGNHGAALGAYTAALAAFQQVDNRIGVAETHHNLSITYRDQGNLERSLGESNRAIDEANKSGAEALYARALAGRAETRVWTGDVAVAKREVEKALEMHHKLNDKIGGVEDNRIFGLILSKSGPEDEAESVLKGVISFAEELRQPLLMASAGRDIALLFETMDRKEDALDQARTARTQFHELGARAEVKKLDELINRLT